MSCVSHAFASVHCCLVFTCWERALVCDVYRICYFPMWYPGSGVVLDCSVSWFLPSFLLWVNALLVFKKVKVFNYEDWSALHFQNFTKSSGTEAPFLDLKLSITNDKVSSKIYDKRDDFNFEIAKFPFLDGDVPRSPSYGVYFSQLIHFARICSNVNDVNNRNLF